MTISYFASNSRRCYLDRESKQIFHSVMLAGVYDIKNLNYLEAQTRNAGKTDVVVDYRGEQFIVEMKIGRGNEYNERRKAQLVDYLDYFHRKKGCMLSFNFNQKKAPGVKVITVGDKTIVEAVV